jgi:hypothetical protein
MAPRLTSLLARRQLAFDMSQIGVDQWCVLVAQPSELLLNDFEFLIGHVIELNQPGFCPFDTAQQFIQLQGDNICLSVLSVLDQEDHQKT